MNSILLPESVATTYFGSDEMLRIDNEVNVKVTGV